MAVDFAQYSVTLHSIMLRGVSAQYHAARSQSRKTRITRRNLYKDLKYVFEPITQWPRQTGITKKGRKSCLTVPLKGIWQSHMTPRSIILRGILLHEVLCYCAEI